jgi:predicted aminopeptidase
LKPGGHRWALRFTETASGEIEDGETGSLRVLANVGIGQVKSAARLALDECNTAITTLAASTNSSVSFNGQSFTKKDMGALLRQRQLLQAEVHREQQAEAALNGENTGNFYQVRFQ